MVFKKKKIATDLTLSQRLRRQRLRRGLSLEETELATKIKTKYLQVIEDDRLDLLPTGAAYGGGFLRHYGEFLGLKNLTQEIQLAENLRPTSLRPAWRLTKNRILLTPKILAAGGLTIIIGGLMAYIYFEVARFSRPPLIVVDQPAEFKTAYEKLTISGDVEAAVLLKINQELVPMEQDGRFRQDVRLKTGLNEIQLTATNRLNKQANKTLHILYDPKT